MVVQVHFRHWRWGLLLLLTLLLLFTLVMPPTFLPVGTAQAAGDLTIYDDALASGWQDWSWDSTRNFAKSTPVHSGTASLSVKYTAAWGGLQLRAPAAIDTNPYTTISFWVHGGSSNHALSLYTQATDDGATSRQFAFTAPAAGWANIQVPLSALGNPRKILLLVIMDGGGSAQPVFYLDDIKLIANTGTPTPTRTPTLTPTPLTITLNVDVAADRKPISPDIYGINFASEALATAINLPVRRWGGNATSRYNWQNDISNHAYDWYFENIKQTDATNLPDDSEVNRFIAQDRRTGAKTFLTLPMSGWVANNDATTCGFSVTKYTYTPLAYPSGYPPTDDERPHCGTGIIQIKNGWEAVFFTGNDPLDTSIAIDQNFVGNWVTYLKNKFGAAASGGVLFYNLDNEPDLWNSTHADVHPVGLTYDELRDRTQLYAAAVKASDPTAKIAGPAFGGWWAYFDSAIDVAAGNQADRQAHGDVPLTDWYLQQMRAYEQSHQIRLLDYLDLHYYPQANGVALSNAGNAANQALRLRSTRALWDPTYVDESWIRDAGPDGGIVRLLPRMRDWVNNNYPGTKLAISEYNWGALNHINGALAQADVLGIFGREGLDLATLWSGPTVNQPGAFAFRMYRNYDGAGSQFGDISVRASSSDQEKLAIYAAQDNSTNAVTLLIINKTSAAINAQVNLASFTPAANAAVYRYSAANLTAIEHLVDQVVTATGFTANFPANAITLLRLNAQTAVPTPTATPTPSPTVTPSNAAITIQVEAQPDSIQNFRFTGGLGAFNLDDANPDDNDGVNKSRTVSKAAGVYVITQTVPAGWTLTAIACTPAAKAQVDLANARVTLTAASSDTIACTFTDQRTVTINTRKFADLNGNKIRSAAEPWLAGWAMTVYNDSGTVVATGSTNELGKANFIRLRPGPYTVCETQQAGWNNTLPGTLHPTFTQPCASLTLEPNQSATVTFGNRQLQAGQNAATTDQFPGEETSGVVISNDPDVAFDDAGYDGDKGVIEDENQPILDQFMFLPLIQNE